MGFRNPITTAVDPTARDAAAAAQTTANNAQTAANNALSVASARNHVFVQSTAPTTATAALTLDDIWIDTTPGNGNRISSWDGSAWQLVPLGTAAIAAASVTTDLLAAGAVAAGNLAADAINGRTITGGRYYTAATTSGAGVQVYEGTDAAGNPMGFVVFADGRTGVPEALHAPGGALTFELTYDSSGNVTGSTLAVAGDTINGVTAPELDLNVEPNGSSTRAVARILNASIESQAGHQLLTPSTGWGNDTSGSFLPLQVRKDSSGVVHCWGLLRNTSGGTLAAPSILATIPAAFQGPKEQVSCAYAQSGLTRVDYVAGTAQVLQLLAGSLAAGQYIAVNLSWPSNDLSVT